MKKLPLTLLTVACSFALTACYSSGGGGGSTEPPKIDKAKSAKNPQAAGSNSSTNTSAKNANSKFFSAVNDGFATKESTLLSGVILNTSGNGSFKGINPSKNDDLDALDIDGTKITLFNVDDKLREIAVENLKTLSNKDLDPLANKKLSGYVGSQGQYGERGLDFKAVRYGVAIINNVGHPFVQGFLTPETGNISVRGEYYYPIEAKGSFKYTGFAVYGSGNDYKQLTSEVIADFTNKKVKVDLAGDATKLSFGGDINGNTFSGTSKDGIETKGAFYGSLARDVGGVFNYAKEGKNGAFGASNKRSDTTTVTEF
ncbi:transferrin-binding protein-like solute binding protein [Actinobacillus equuli subsp. equuli]|nr:transferrin-binding protein-like solute binding protein [Actinobacillus equuli]WGE54416.1 transferrin-binding protein-like solute binding protein [Actinobacillus equuli subsp. equuli]